MVSQNILIVLPILYKFAIQIKIKIMNPIYEKTKKYNNLV